MGGGIVVQGHGVRERQVWGPQEIGGPPELMCIRDTTVPVHSLPGGDDGRAR